MQLIIGYYSQNTNIIAKKQEKNGKMYHFHTTTLAELINAELISELVNVDPENKCTGNNTTNKVA